MLLLCEYHTFRHCRGKHSQLWICNRKIKQRFCKQMLCLSDYLNRGSETIYVVRSCFLSRLSTTVISSMKIQNVTKNNMQNIYVPLSILNHANVQENGGNKYMRRLHIKSIDILFFTYIFDLHILAVFTSSFPLIYQC